ncbi:MAG: TolC family protein [Bdellovibrionota bacterium]
MNNRLWWWKVTSYLRWAIAAAGLIYVVGAKADSSTWDLDAYLKQVSSNNALIQSSRLQKEAAALKKHQGDLQELSPFLQVEGGYVNDGTETAIPAQQGKRTITKFYSLGVSQKFSTGTTVSVGWSQNNTDIDGLAFPFTPAWDSRYTLGVSQSLWKDGFGRGVGLRHEREDAQERVSVLTAELQERQALIDAESAYWDLAVQVLDRDEKANALARAEKIHAWTKRRLDSGIGDRADRLQIESLIASRRLAQINSADSYENARKRFADALGTASAEVGTLNADILMNSRPLSPGEGKDPNRLDMWIQSYAAKISETAARETQEMLRPDLALTGAFGANARDPGIGTSTSDAFASDTSFYKVGLKLSMSLDFGLKHNLRAAADAEAKAARMKSNKLSRDTASSWDEIVRRHKELGNSIDAMEVLVKAQQAQLDREQERLSTGRSTTFQVITFEQSVADTKFSLLQLRAAQRKLEAASRLYMTQNAVEAL